jgi:hypothetical protein
MDPKNRPPWQPRIDREPELNPSVRTTPPESDVDERSLEQIEEEAEESEAREDEAEPIKIHHRE